MKEDAKLDLYEGAPKDHIDLQKGEWEPEKQVQLVYGQKEVLLNKKTTLRLNKIQNLVLYLIMKKLMNI